MNKKNYLRIVSLRVCAGLIMINIAIDIKKGVAVVRFYESWRIVMLHYDGRVIKKRGLWPGRLRRIFFWNIVLPVEVCSERAVLECLAELAKICEYLSIAQGKQTCYKNIDFLAYEDVCESLERLYRRSMSWRWHIRNMFL